MSGDKWISGGGWFSFKRASDRLLSTKDKPRRSLPGSQSRSDKSEFSAWQQDLHFERWLPDTKEAQIYQSHPTTEMRDILLPLRMHRGLFNADSKNPIKITKSWSDWEHIGLFRSLIEGTYYRDTSPSLQAKSAALFLRKFLGTRSRASANGAQN